MNDGSKRAAGGPRRRASVLAFALPFVLVGLLSGCAPWTLLPHPNPGGVTHSTSASRDRACSDGRPLEIDGAAIRTAITGSCGKVTIRGDNIVVRIATASALEIDGQSVTVTTPGGVGAVVVRGNVNHIRAASLGSISIQGNRNVVTATTVASLTLRGNQNVIATNRTPGSVSQTGEGNQLKQR